MRKFFHITTLVVFVLLSIVLCLGQSPATPAPAGSPAPAAATPSTAAGGQDADIRGSFGVSLVKPLDSKKLKEGDAVICQTFGVMRSRSGLMIPTGSKVYGHITQSTARSKGDSGSTLAMVFDKIQVTGGKEIPMKGVLQAVGPSLGTSEPNTGAAGSGQMMPGRGNASTMAPPTGGSVAGPNSGIHPLDNTGTHPILNSESAGVLGIKNLQMEKDSVLTSSGKEVKLDAGTQMMIRGDIQLPMQ